MRYGMQKALQKDLHACSLVRNSNILDRCLSSTAITNCACADLVQKGWVEKLLQAGWQQDLPTIWIAEGLLYNLPDEAASGLLQVQSMQHRSLVLMDSLINFFLRRKYAGHCVGQLLVNIADR